MRLRNGNKIILFIAVIITFTAVIVFAQNYGVNAVRDIDNILPERQRAELQNQILAWRLDNILPTLMRREQIDMWLVICREYNEDPVYLTLVPQPNVSARRTSILIFCDKGPSAGVERLTGSFYDMPPWYKSMYTDKKKDQIENLAAFIKERNPKKIGVNVSDAWAFGDGLSASLYEALKKALGSDYSARLVSAERICVGWLETRSPQEISIYRHICGISHDLIGEFFSNKVITPDITTTDDVVWWIRQRITDFGLETWFQPSIEIQRSKEEAVKNPQNDMVIRRGDLIHCDVGIKYLGLCTDNQEFAYVLKQGEFDLPIGINEAFRRGNRLQNIVMSEHTLGKTGNEILRISLEKAKAEGLIPSIYCHPLGVHGHAAGLIVGLWDQQNGVPVRGDYPLYANTVYSIELNNRFALPEWGGQEVSIGLEEDAVFDGKQCILLDGRQTKLYLIK